MAGNTPYMFHYPKNTSVETIEPNIKGLIKQSEMFGNRLLEECKSLSGFTGFIFFQEICFPHEVSIADATHFVIPKNMLARKKKIIQNKYPNMQLINTKMPEELYNTYYTKIYNNCMGIFGKIFEEQREFILKINEDIANEKKMDEKKNISK